MSPEEEETTHSRVRASDAGRSLDTPARPDQAVPLMKIESYGSTDCGRKRPHNEDAFFLGSDIGIFVVADGMGGHAAGEVASRLAVETLSEALARPTPPDVPFPDLVQAALEETNQRIAERIESEPDTRGMGTTVVLVIVREDRLFVAHVGDSRVYRIRDGAIEQLTSDHSFVNELVRLGMLSREQAARDPRRNVVTRALGSGPGVQPDFCEDGIQPGDRILLCSDGLNTMLPDEEILRIVDLHATDIPRATQELIQAANDSGGEDNITVILLRFYSNGETEPTNPQ